MSKTTNGSLYNGFDWIFKFAYVNILWMLFSLLGLVLFGFFPATVALFTIIRKWLMGNGDIFVFKTFWNTYKKEFLKSNLLGLILVIIGAIFYLDLYFIKENTSSIQNLLYIPLYMFIFSFLLTSLYLFPVYVHYDTKVFQVLKNAFLIMLINPLYNLLMISGVVITYYGLSFIPGLLFFFGGSVIAYSLMWPSYKAFQKVERHRKI